MINRVARGLPRGAVACEAPAGRGNPVGFGGLAANVLQLQEVGDFYHKC